MKRWMLIAIALLALAAGGLMGYCLKRSHVAPGESSPKAPISSSILDGQGTATVSPTNAVFAATYHTWEITYTAGKDGIPKGGGVVLQISPWWGWSPPQNVDPSYAGYTTVKTDASGVKLDFSTDPDREYAIALVAGGSLKEGEKVIFTYGAATDEESPGGEARADYYAEKSSLFLVKTDGNGDGHFKAIDNSPSITVLGGPAAILIANAPSNAVVGQPFTVKIAALDELGNRSSLYEAKLAVEAKGVKAKYHREAFMAYEAAGAASFTAVPLEEGLITFEVSETDGQMKAVSNPVRVSASEPAYRLYWLDVHGHTALSDGTGTPHDYYSYARDIAGLDGAAVTDHDHWGFFPLDENPGEWEEIKRAANEAYVPGMFVAFVGYEYTDWEEGHYTVLYPAGDGALLSSSDPKTDNPKKLWAAMGKKNVLTIPHHPGGGPVPIDWSYFDPLYEPVVEVVSVHGVSVNIDDPLAIYNPSPGRFAIDALARGYPLGFIGGGDSHNGHPGIKDVRAPTGGLAGIWAKDLTREGIWRSIKARRCYATTGAKIIIEFEVNGAFMGEFLKMADPKESRIFKAKIVGTAPIALVELIKNGRLLAAKRPLTESAEFSFTEYGDAKRSDYYYLHVVQTDNEAAWSSPVWIDLK